MNIRPVLASTTAKDEGAAPSEPAGDVVEAENVAETGQTYDIEYTEPTGFDWGIEVRNKDKVLFSRNCSNEVPPKVIIIFE